MTQEYLPYLALEESAWRSAEGDKLFEQGVQLVRDRVSIPTVVHEAVQSIVSQVQLHTRQYSTSQRKWARNRFLRVQSEREVYGSMSRLR